MSDSELAFAGAAFDAVDEGEGFGDDLIEFVWDGVAEVEFDEDFDEGAVFMEGDAVFAG